MLAVCLVVSVAVGRRPTAGPFDADVDAFRDDVRLQRVLETVDVDHVKLSEAAVAVGRQAGLNVVPRWAAAAGADDPVVTLHLRRVTAAAALDAVLQAAGQSSSLDWSEQAGLVTIDAASETSLVVRVYDVRPLLDAVKGPHDDDPPTGPRAVPTGQVRVVDTPEARAEERADNLKALVESNADPSSWKDNGGEFGSASLYDGRLVVTHTPRGQRRVAAFLENLRRR